MCFAEWKAVRGGVAPWTPWSVAAGIWSMCAAHGAGITGIVRCCWRAGRGAFLVGICKWVGCFRSGLGWPGGYLFEDGAQEESQGSTTEKNAQALINFERRSSGAGTSGLLFPTRACGA